MGHRIAGVSAVEVLDSRSRPTLQVSVTLEVSTAEIEDVDRWRRAARSCARRLGVREGQGSTLEQCRGTAPILE
jgi:hypothetical protein